VTNTRPDPQPPVDELERTLRALSRARATVEPGPAFEARIASAALQRRARSRRRRAAVGALAAAAAIAVAAVVVLRGADATAPSAVPPPVQPVAGDPGPAPEIAVDELLALTDVEAALHFSADWSAVDEPLARYARLLEEDPR